MCVKLCKSCCSLRDYWLQRVQRLHDVNTYLPQTHARHVEIRIQMNSFTLAFTHMENFVNLLVFGLWEETAPVRIPTQTWEKYGNITCSQDLLALRQHWVTEPLCIPMSSSLLCKSDIFHLDTYLQLSSRILSLRITVNPSDVNVFLKIWNDWIFHKSLPKWSEWMNNQCYSWKIDSR